MLNRRLSSTYASGSMGAPEQSLPQEGVSPRKQCQPAQDGGQACGGSVSYQTWWPGWREGHVTKRTLHPEAAGTHNTAHSNVYWNGPLD